MRFLIDFYGAQSIDPCHETAHGRVQLFARALDVLPDLGNEGV